MNNRKKEISMLDSVVFELIDECEDDIKAAVDTKECKKKRRKKK